MWALITVAPKFAEVPVDLQRLGSNDRGSYPAEVGF